MITKVFFCRAAIPLAASLLLAACSNPGQSYAQKHPELTEGQQKVMKSGKPESGTAVAGLTKEQIHLAMGDPAQQTKIDGRDAWVYVRSTSKSVPLDSNRGRGSLAGDGDRGDIFDAPEWTDANIRTTIYFEGNLAVRADVVEERKSNE